MSLSLHVAPVNPPKSINLGGMPVKSLLCRAFGQGDGTLKVDFVLTKGHIPVLDAIENLHGETAFRHFHPTGTAIDGAKEVSEAIATIKKILEEHGAAELWTE